MTAVLFTTDTELSFMLHGRGLSALENFRIAVMGEVSDGVWGIGYQMQRLSAHGLKGVFFVEALSSYLFGIDSLQRVVHVILEAGHEVQLHLHTEWLKWIEKDLVGDRRGQNIADFTYNDQHRLLGLGIEALIEAGAPKPTAFRAGNYGASNDTLKALAAHGLTYDSSYNRTYLGDSCHIKTTAEPLSRPTRLEGLTEVPVTFFADYPGHTRSLQLCAVSAAEFDSVLDQSIEQKRLTTVVVNHSFELLNLKRTRANRMLLGRFDRYCASLAARKGEIVSADFRTLALPPRAVGTVKPLTSNPVRTALRMIEQSVGAYLYDRV